MEHQNLAISIQFWGLGRKNQIYGLPRVYPISQNVSCHNLDHALFSTCVQRNPKGCVHQSDLLVASVRPQELVQHQNLSTSTILFRVPQLSLSPNCPGTPKINFTTTSTYHSYAHMSILQLIVQSKPTNQLYCQGSSETFLTQLFSSTKLSHNLALKQRIGDSGDPHPQEDSSKIRK